MSWGRWNSCQCNHSIDTWCDCCDGCDVPILFNIVPQESPPNVCFIEVNGLQATQPYDYQIEGGTTLSGTIITDINGQAIIAGLNCGVFHAIQILLGCRFGEEDFITPLEQCATVDILFTYQVTYNCDTSNNVTILATSGGNPPYEYSIDGQNWQNNDTFGNLPEGLYQFYVRDQDGCISGPLVANIIQPPEFKGLGWLSSDGDGFTGAGNSVFVYSCLGNSNYLIKSSAPDPVYFDYTDTYGPYFPLLDGETYQIEIDIPGIAGNNPRIWAEENAVAIFDTGCGATPGTYSFTFTYNAGDDLKIWFGRCGAGGAIVTFQLVTFNTTCLTCP